MFILYKDIKNFEIEASNGSKGRVRDFYFDDKNWEIRYLVVKSGFLFNTSESLITTGHLRTPDLKENKLTLTLTKEQIEDAANPEEDPPVSTQHERAVARLQAEAIPPVAIGLPGVAYTPALAERELFGEDGEDRIDDDVTHTTSDPHLRSMDEISGYSLAARDDNIGAISDFILNPDTWQVRYVVADTGNWLPGRQVAIKPEWINEIRWDDQRILVDVTKETVETAPELSDLQELERSAADLVVSHYGAYGAVPM